VSLADPFATPSDVEARWRPLDEAETARAAVLLADASRMIRRRPWNVDARIAAGTLDAEDVRMVVAAMVRRAMLGVETADGVTEQAETVGPFQVNRKFSNPLGNLYLSADDVAVLEPPVAGGGKRAFVIDLMPD
jgi:Gp19/Gp15/Gp42-like protein